jgi:hypothetical protein
MPTNVRHHAVVWRCQDSVTAEGNTNCRVARWADGYRRLKDKWNTQHSWVGKGVVKMFDNVMYNGIIEQWLPDSKSEWELWRIQYEDGDMEKLDILELMPVLKENANVNPAKPQAPTSPNTTKRDLTRKDKRRERKRRRQLTNTISDHDTLPNGQIAGRIHASNTIITTFIATINGSTIGVRGDRHCLRRSLGKLWDMHPGEVIRKMREGARHLQQNDGKLKIESSEEWYECTINRPRQWCDIQSNTNHVCSREDWGGDNELCLWAYITQPDNHHTYTKKTIAYIRCINQTETPCPQSTMHGNSNGYMTPSYYEVQSVHILCTMGTTITQFGTEMKHHMTKTSLCQYGWPAHPRKKKRGNAQ